jgi:hypothetical protein
MDEFGAVVDTAVTQIRAQRFLHRVGLLTTHGFERNLSALQHATDARVCAVFDRMPDDMAGVRSTARAAVADLFDVARHTG